MAGLDDSEYLRGEYTTPDGNVIAVDVMKRNGIVCAAHIDGDFTLKPDSTRDAVNAALGKQPFFAAEAHIAKAIREALTDDATLTGATPEDIATAMRRALDMNDPT